MCVCAPLSHTHSLYGCVCARSLSLSLYVAPSGTLRMTVLLSPTPRRARPNYPFAKDLRSPAASCEACFLLGELSSVGGRLTLRQAVRVRADTMRHKMCQYCCPFARSVAQRKSQTRRNTSRLCSWARNLRLLKTPRGAILNSMCAALVHVLPSCTYCP